MEKIAEITIESEKLDELGARHAALKSAARRAAAEGRGVKVITKLAKCESDAGDHNAAGTVLYEHDNADAAFATASAAAHILPQVFRDATLAMAVYAR